MSFFEIRVYGDESYAQPGYGGRTYTTYPFVIAGYVGKVKEWKRFEKEWHRILKAEQKRNASFPGYFHMSDCEGGYKDFDYLDLKTDDGRKERDRLQTVFIDALNRFDVYGVVAGCPQADIARIRDELARYREPGDREVQELITPYLFALEMFFNAMCRRLVGHEDKQVSFVMDQELELEARAQRVRARLVANIQYANRDRLGPLTYCGKKHAVSLQVDDILVYDAMHNIRDTHVNLCQLACIER
jgi:hypothetical protein